MAGPQKLTTYPQLLFLLPPLLVYFLASFLFELSVDPAQPVVKKLLEGVKVGAALDLKHLLIELKARYMWLASALLNIVIPIVAIIVSIATIRSYVKGMKLVRTIIVGLLLCLGNLGYLMYSAMTENALYELVFGFTYKMLARSGLFSNVFLLHVYIIISTINILAAVTPILLLLAVCGTLGLPKTPGKDNLDHLAQQLCRLKEIINVGSAFLVFGILHMNMWLNWPASLVRDPGPGSEVANLAWSISIYWGVAFTLVLTLTYVPATVFLQNRAREFIAKDRKAMGPKEAEQWLSDHGFSFTFSSQLLQYISILAPVLAAPVGSILKFQ